IKSRVRVVSGFVDRPAHRAVPAEFFAHPLAPMRDAVGPRRQAGQGLEHPMEVEDAESNVARQLLQARRTLRGLDETAGLGHLGGVLLDEARLIRLAALAGPEPCGLRLLARPMETDVFRPGQPGSA